MTHRLQLAAALLCAALVAPRLTAQSPPANSSSPRAQSAPAAKIPKPTTPAASTTISAAVCPVVYQLDDSPTRRGYHYIFFGNAFFINRDGYLLTAAHVLSEFRNGGQPSVLLSRPYAPPRLVRVTVVATDVLHDVAILRATPNPFDAGYTVAALPLADGKLSDGRPAAGDPLAIQALRPARAKDPETFRAPHPGKLQRHHTHLPRHQSRPRRHQRPLRNSSLAAAQLTDIFLFSHEVIRGQSGAPVTNASTHQVVGLIEGRWLHPTSGSPVRKPRRRVALPSHCSSPSDGDRSLVHPRLPKIRSADCRRHPPSLTQASLTQGAAVPISYAKSLLQRNHIPWTTTAPQ